MQRWAFVGVMLAGLTAWGADDPTVSYTGRVVDRQGQPVAGVRVMAVTAGYRSTTRPGSRPKPPPSFPPDVGVSGADGRFTLVLPRPAEGWYYRLRIDSPAARWVSGGDLTAGEAAAAASDLVVDRLDGVVAGKVVDRLAQPVAGAAVFVPGYGAKPARTGTDGRFELTGVPAAQVRVVALAGDVDRGQRLVEAGARDAVIALQSKGSPDTPVTRDQRDELARLVEAAYQQVRLPEPSRYWVTLPQLMARYDRPRAWALIRDLPDGAMKEAARQALLENTARTDPAQALKELGHLDDFTSARRQEACANLARLLAGQDRATALALYERAQVPKFPVNGELDQSLLDTGLLAACLALNQRQDLALREQAALASVRRSAGAWHYLAPRVLGWRLGEWPDTAERLLPCITDAESLRQAELAFWGHLADRDAELAANLYALQFPPGKAGRPVAMTDVLAAFRGDMAQRIALRLAPKEPETAVAIADDVARDPLRLSTLPAVVSQLPPAARAAAVARLRDPQSRQVSWLRPDGQTATRHVIPPVTEFERLARRWRDDEPALAQQMHGAATARREVRDQIRIDLSVDPRAAFYRAWTNPNGAWLDLEARPPTAMVGIGDPFAADAAVWYLPVDFEQAVAFVRDGLAAPDDYSHQGLWHVLSALEAAVVWADLSPAERRVSGVYELHLPDPREPFREPVPW